jgi:hypothetical protein
MRMRRPLISTSVLLILVGMAAVLPIAIVLLAALAALLNAMGDPVGRNTLGWIACGVGLVWLLDLVCLVLAMAVRALDAPHAPGDDETEL